jgi:hypothetical protein
MASTFEPAGAVTSMAAHAGAEQRPDAWLSSVLSSGWCTSGQQGPSSSCADPLELHKVQPKPIASLTNRPCLQLTHQLSCVFLWFAHAAPGAPCQPA